MAEETTDPYDLASVVDGLFKYFESSAEDWKSLALAALVAGNLDNFDIFIKRALYWGRRALAIKELKENGELVSSDSIEGKTIIRDVLVSMRDDALKALDFDGAIILSHAVRWLHFKIEGKPYEPATD